MTAVNNDAFFLWFTKLIVITFDIIQGEWIHL